MTANPNAAWNLRTNHGDDHVDRDAKWVWAVLGVIALLGYSYNHNDQPTRDLPPGAPSVAEMHRDVGLDGSVGLDPP